MKQKVYFYFPYQEESGVPMLFSRVAKWLATHYGDKYEVYVIDYTDGAMARNLKPEDRVSMKEFRDDEDCRIEDDAIIVMQSNNPKLNWEKELKLSPKTKVFWWTLHIRCLAPTLLPSPFGDMLFTHHWMYKFVSLFYWRFMHDFAHLVDNMMDHGALHFMDEPNWKEAKKHLPIKHQSCDHYLPVPAGDYNGELKSNPCLNPVKLCWLGRVELEKLPILEYTLKKASEYALKHKRKVEFIILGYGADADYIDNLPVENEWFVKHKIQPIKAADINSFLLENADAMFALATSSLEAAKLGIPTIMLDSTYKPITGDYIYKYITERKGCELTHVIGKDDFEEGNDSFEKIMDGIINRYNEIGKNCRQYFLKNHSLSCVGEQLVKLLDTSTFTYDMMNKRLFKSFLLWNIFMNIRNK